MDASPAICAISPGMGRDEVRMAYVLNKEDLARAMKILSAALQAYPGRTV